MTFILSIVLFFSSYSESINNEIDVYIFLHESCLISQYYTPKLNQLYSDYADDDIHFIGVFPNEVSTLSGIDSFHQKYNIAFELVKDEDQSLTQKLGAKVTPEAILVDRNTEKIIYQGRIDDSYFRVGKRRTVTTTNELEDVLSALKAGKEVPVAETIAVGCLIQFIQN